MDLAVAENNIKNGENNTILVEEDSTSGFDVKKSKIIRTKGI